MKNLLLIFIIPLFFLSTGCDFFNTVTNSVSKKEIIEYNKLEMKKNDMGLVEMYFEGEPFTGFGAMSKMTLESGAIVYMAQEYSNGKLLIGRDMVYIDVDGKDTQFSFNAVKDTEQFIE